MKQLRARGLVRRVVGAAGATTLVAGGLLIGTASTAWANAATPQPTTTVTVTANGDGTVSVSLQGTWAWPGQNCAGRYGTGYAVDWWGISQSKIPNNSRVVVSQTQVTGVDTVTTLPGSGGPAGSIPLKVGDLPAYFHVSQYYSGEDVYSPDNQGGADSVLPQGATCTDSVPGGGGNDISSGPWAAQATYDSMQDVPAQLCVVMYDEHGNEGRPSGPFASGSQLNRDFDPVNNNDNTIFTNAFVPSFNGGCVNTASATTSSTTQTLSADIFLCNPDGSTSTSEVLGGTIAAVGPQIVPPTPNPLASVDVASGTYNVAASPPSGYGLTDCNTGVGSPQSVTVPASSTASAVFYVQPLPPPVLTAHIYSCPDGVTTTGLELSGGQISVTQNAQLITSASNPLTTSVPAGIDTVSATAPAGSYLTSCNTGNDPSAQMLAMQAGGSYTVDFYAAPPPTLAVHIYLCDGHGGSTEVPDGTVVVTQNSATVIPSARTPMSATSEPPGTYTVTATAPSGYYLVPCDLGASSSVNVTLQAGEPSAANFYVSLPPTVSAHIYLCSGGATPTGTEVPQGQVVVTGSGGAQVAGGNNPLAPTPEAPGSYTITATAPPGYYLTTCYTNSPPSNSPPSPETFSLLPGGAGSGVFYAATQTPSVTTLASSADPSILRQGVTYTATVTSVDGTPPGTVAFSDSGVAIAGCTAVPVVSISATCTPPAYTVVGGHVITAVFTPSSDQTIPSTSLPFGQEVLHTATLKGATLTGMNFEGANLSGQVLTGTNLTGANLSGVNLTGANLSGANLSGANLSGANLTNANLSGANLTKANLAGAVVGGANFTGANLTGETGLGSDAGLSTVIWAASTTCADGKHAASYANSCAGHV